jgi:hypothetical protein
MARPRSFDNSERTQQPPPWEPEPLQLPIELPRGRDDARRRRDERDEAPLDIAEPRVLVIDLV